MTPPPIPSRGNFEIKSVNCLYFLENLLLYFGAWFRQTKCALIMIMEGSNNVLNSMTPRAGVLVLGRGRISHIVKMHHFYKYIYFSIHRHGQSMFRVMMTNEGSTKNIKFMTPGAEVLVL